MKKLNLTGAALALVVAVAVSAPAWAHSGEELERRPTCGMLVAIAAAKTQHVLPAELVRQQGPLVALDLVHDRTLMLISHFDQIHRIFADPALARLPILRAILLKLQPEHFNVEGRVFLLTRYGLSVWDKADFAAWDLLAQQMENAVPAPGSTTVTGGYPFDGIAIATREQQFLRLLMTSQRLIPGLSPTLVDDFRRVYRNELVTAGLVQASTLAAKVSRRGRRRLPLVFTKNDAHISPANARGLVQFALVRTLVDHLVSPEAAGELRPLLSSHQREFAAWYPELIPYLRRSPASSPELSLSESQRLPLPLFQAPDWDIEARHPARVGLTAPYLFDHVSLNVFERQMNALGFDPDFSIDFELVRTLDGRDFPEALRIVLPIRFYRKGGIPARLEETERSHLQWMIAALFHAFPELARLDVTLREDVRPGPKTGSGPRYVLDLGRADLATRVHVLNVLKEIEIHQDGRAHD